MAVAAQLTPEAVVPAAGGGCTPSPLTTGGLNGVFGHAVDGIEGADYLHAHPLPDGRTLWLVQDPYLGASDDELADRLVHNSALVERDGCFSALHGGTVAAPTSWIGGDRETPLRHWFWPLDGAIGTDGLLHVFVAEMANSGGTGAGMGAHPLGTWVAAIDVSAEPRVVSLAPAPDPGRELYGWAVTSDGTWSYLFSYCNEQFDPASAGFASCTSTAHVERVPVGRFDLRGETLTASGWSADPNAVAEPVVASHTAAMSIERFGATYVSVSKDGEWFGNRIVVRSASEPAGPWQDAASVDVGDQCSVDCVTYSAQLMPWLDGGMLVVALSHNVMPGSTNSSATRYRTGFVLVDVPALHLAA